MFSGWVSVKIGCEGVTVHDEVFLFVNELEQLEGSLIDELLERHIGKKRDVEIKRREIVNRVDGDDFAHNRYVGRNGDEQVNLHYF